jgi:hypothetical protein
MDSNASSESSVRVSERGRFRGGEVDMAVLFDSGSVIVFVSESDQQSNLI